MHILSFVNIHKFYRKIDFVFFVTLLPLLHNSLNTMSRFALTLMSNIHWELGKYFLTQLNVYKFYLVKNLGHNDNDLSICYTKKHKNHRHSFRFHSERRKINHDSHNGAIIIRKVITIIYSV